MWPVQGTGSLCLCLFHPGTAAHTCDSALPLIGAMSSAPGACEPLEYMVSGVSGNNLHSDAGLYLCPILCASVSPQCPQDPVPTFTAEPQPHAAAVMPICTPLISETIPYVLTAGPPHCSVHNPRTMRNTAEWGLDLSPDTNFSSTPPRLSPDLLHSAGDDGGGSQMGTVSEDERCQCWGLLIPTLHCLRAEEFPGR
jgi:hypothetical protein